MFSFEMGGGGGGGGGSFMTFFIHGFIQVTCRIPYCICQQSNSDKAGCIYQCIGCIYCIKEWNKVQCYSIVHTRFFCHPSLSLDNARDQLSPPGISGQEIDHGFKQQKWVLIALFVQYSTLHCGTVNCHGVFVNYN